MATIRDIHNPWRDQIKAAFFRGAMFHVETGSRLGGRRVAPHSYPKRNDPYSEDMGRTARRFVVQGYIVGPDYLTLKDALIEALEKDGPGTLRLPYPIAGGNAGDMQVMVMNYTITETRERGGMCDLEMDFVEAGTPGNRPSASTENTQATVNKTATASDGQVAIPTSGVAASVAAVDPTTSLPDWTRSGGWVASGGWVTGDAATVEWGGRVAATPGF